MAHESGRYEITENQLLNRTLELLDRLGAVDARAYLEANQQHVDSRNRVQIENFRYCLAAVCGDKEEALRILKTAVIDEGYWYRPEVFDDEDLQSLRDEPRFNELKELSYERYQNALSNISPCCTWKGKNADRILIALHGNQENLFHAKAQWDIFRSEKMQVEYIQSGEPDSYGIYRWEEDGPGALQLGNILKGIEWESYHERILAGFSAGCNVIARAVSEKTVRCSHMILVAPWLPSFKDNGFDPLCAALGHTRVLIVCGTLDKDCLPGAQEFADTLEKHKADCRLEVIPESDHGFPDGFSDIVLSWLAR